jgi:hypothetical protein
MQNSSVRGAGREAGLVTEWSAALRAVRERFGLCEICIICGILTIAAGQRCSSSAIQVSFGNSFVIFVPS